MPLAHFGQPLTLLKHCFSGSKCDRLRKMDSWREMAEGFRPCDQHSQLKWSTKVPNMCEGLRRLVAPPIRNRLQDQDKFLKETIRVSEHMVSGNAEWMIDDRPIRKTRRFSGHTRVSVPRTNKPAQPKIW